MKTHTPGPWTFKFELRKMFCSTTGEPRHSKNHWVMPPEGIHVALVNESGHEEQVAANARLIAAAPELLGALEKVLPLISAFNEGPWIEAADAVRAALAKASGGS